MPLSAVIEFAFLVIGWLWYIMIDVVVQELMAVRLVFSYQKVYKGILHSEKDG